MIRKATSSEQRQKLAVAGFIRVDGLKVIDRVRSPKAEYPQWDYVIEPDVAHIGHFDSNNGMTVIVTEGGEVWLAIDGLATHEQAVKRSALLCELCPDGAGAFVPCSNGEELAWSDIMCRLTNPDWTRSYPSRP